MIGKQLTALRKLAGSLPSLGLDGSDQASLALQNHQQQLLQLEQEIVAGLDLLVASRQREAALRRQHRHLQNCCQLLLEFLVEDEWQTTPLKPYTLANEGMLIRLLDFQYQAHGYYFNEHNSVPLLYQTRFLAKMQAQQLLLEAGFKRKKLPQPLQEILISLFAHTDVKNRYSYAQLHYLVCLQTRIINYTQKVSDGDFANSLLAYLIYQNLNYVPFIKYFQQYLEIQHSTIYNVKEQYVFLCEREKYFVCLLENRNTAFDFGKDSAKEQLLAYVNAWMVYHHRLQQPAQLVQQANSPAFGHYRVKLNIGADGLAYLLRLLIEAGVLEAEPRSKLLQFVARHFQTAGIGDQLLSANSISTKYKQVVQRTALNVRSLLKRMTKIVEANFDC